MRHLTRIAALVVAAGLTGCGSLDSGGGRLANGRAPWPQGAGPNGDWTSTGAPPPLRFSVRSGENILWRTLLPETGQGGIAVAKDRLFVATMAPWDDANRLSPEDAERFHHAIEGREVAGKDIDAHCIDRRTGKILWTQRIEGEVPSIYTYPFSDGTSASPVTDGTHVWFTNACGRVVCYTAGGELVWERTFTPSSEGPFNKQFEPFLVQDGARQVFIHMEAFDPPADTDGPAGQWHYLLGLDATTGEVLWRSDDGLTHYNAPTLVETEDGVCILHARGGPHAVPERPVGMSLTRVTGPDAGQAVWRYEDPRGNHEASLQTMIHDDRFAYWVLKDPANAIVLVDIETGEEVREISLVEDVTRTRFATDHEGEPTVLAALTTHGDLEKGVFPARYSLARTTDGVMFQCYATAWGKPTIGPAYSFGRLHTESGRVEYFEVPTDVVRGEGDDRTWILRTPRSARPLNGRGIEVTGDDRCRWDGWDWVFNGSPTRVGDRLYYTLSSGLVYVLDADVEYAGMDWLLALNDLGPVDGVWTANSVSYADGRLYHRTGAELIAIGRR